MPRSLRLLFACAAFTSIAANSQPSLQCPDLAGTLKEYSIDSSSANFLRSVFLEHCQADGSRKSSGGGLGLDAVVNAVPLNFTGEYSSAEMKMTEFCKRYRDYNEGASNRDAYKETISRRALETIQQCYAIQATGTMVTHQVSNAESANFYLKSSVTSPLEIKGVSITGSVVCEGVVGGKRMAFDSATTFKVPSTTGFACKRKGTPGPRDSTSFDEAIVTVLTNQGNYTMFWPMDEKQGPRMATEITRRITALEGDLAVAKANLAPLVAAISIPVFKCPSGTQGVSYNTEWMYVGCNGQISTTSTCTNAWSKQPNQVLKCDPIGSIRLIQ